MRLRRPVPPRRRPARCRSCRGTARVGSHLRLERAQPARGGGRERALQPDRRPMLGVEAQVGADEVRPDELAPRRPSKRLLAPNPKATKAELRDRRNAVASLGTSCTAPPTARNWKKYVAPRRGDRAASAGELGREVVGQPRVGPCGSPSAACAASSELEQPHHRVVARDAHVLLPRAAPPRRAAAAGPATVSGSSESTARHRPARSSAPPRRWPRMRWLVSVRSASVDRATPRLEEGRGVAGVEGELGERRSSPTLVDGRSRRR